MNRDVQVVHCNVDVSRAGNMYRYSRGDLDVKISFKQTFCKSIWFMNSTFHILFAGEHNFLRPVAASTAHGVSVVGR